MRTLEDAVEEAAATDSVDYEGEDDPAPVLPAPLAPRLGLSADNSNTGDFETYNRAVKNPANLTALSMEAAASAAAELDLLRFASP